MPYLWLKGLHVGMALLTVGGILAVALYLAIIGSGQAEPSFVRSSARIVRRWDQRVTLPALAFVWIFGLTLAVEGAWLPQQWLVAKMGLVTILSGLHGVQSGLVGKLARGRTPTIWPAQIVATAVVVIAIAVAILAVVKP